MMRVYLHEFDLPDYIEIYDISLDYLDAAFVEYEDRDPDLDTPVYAYADIKFNPPFIVKLADRDVYYIAFDHNHVIRAKRVSVPYRV